MKLCLLCNSKYDDSILVCQRDGAKLVSAGNDSLLDTIVGEKYYIDELIGKGSVGRVYKAHRLSDNSLVAIKVLRENLSNDAEALARFKREAQMLSIIEHPNIIALYDFGQTPSGELYFAAEYLAGKTLATIISEKRCLTVSEAQPIFAQVCSALAEAHSHGFIHRDIKPTNIILVETGAAMVAKLLDFSLAKLPPLAVEDKVTKDGMLRGTPAYMSPEQCQSMEVDNLSDIYSLAVVVFETLTGSRPFFNKNSVITMHQQMNDAPPLMMTVRPDLHFCGELETLIQQCLAKNPSNRPRTVEEFWQKFVEACEAQRKISELEVSPIFSERSQAEAVNKLTPLEAFREADERRLVLEKILADEAMSKLPPEQPLPRAAEPDDSAGETIRLTKEELESRFTTAVKEKDDKPSSELDQPEIGSERENLFVSLWRNDLGRKVILGSVIFVLLIILVTTLLLTPIPGPSAP
ncbi:MAG: serine/threonine protein kinase [Candidatus Melainabacteria bacterium]|nr:serine/threonine protein kinase [Candidatus Melainabacteria bacterium]